MAGKASNHFAYVFERFPTFTQTFCVREVLELQRLGMRPLLFSIRDTRDEPLEKHFPPELIGSVHFVPERKELKELVESWKDAGELPQEAVLTLRHWGERSDKARVYEAIYIGAKMREAGVKHAHSHFAGVGARCCYWLKRFYGITFSFTGHANDLFEKVEFEVGLDDLMREAALVVTVSDYTAAWLTERFRKEASKVRRVYNGLDLTPFEGAGDMPVSEREALVVSVGRLIEKKGFDDLVRACGRARELYDGTFRCVIVGDGPMEEELDALIEELDLGGVVTLAGAKNLPEIVELLGDARAFALPCVTEKSGGKDNLPTVIMEAMAAGLPCVSTKLAGVPEMVIDGESGLLTEERQPQAFGEQMAELLCDPALCEKMGAEGKERARALFAKEETAPQLRSHLIAHGCVRFDFSLFGRSPKLAFAYLAQAGRRIAGVFRRRPPSRFVLAERKAREARKA